MFCSSILTKCSLFFTCFLLIFSSISLAVDNTYTGKYIYQENWVAGELILSEAAGNGYMISIETVNTETANTCEFKGKCLAKENGILICRDNSSDEDDKFIIVRRHSDNSINIQNQYPHGYHCGNTSSIDGVYNINSSKNVSNKELAKNHQICGYLQTQKSFPGLVERITVKDYNTKKSKNFYFATADDCDDFTKNKQKNFLLCFDIVEENNDHMGMEKLGIRDIPMQWIDNCVAPN